jgi:hypothetical protein
MLKGSEREVLLDDLGRASIAKTMDHDSIIIFDLRDYQRPPYGGQSPYRVEGRMLDRDGTELTVALYADCDGHLLELEFIRWGEGQLIEPDWPRWSFIDCAGMGRLLGPGETVQSLGISAARLVVASWAT